MNFIYTFFIFLITSASLYTVGEKVFTTGEVHGAFIVFGTIALVAAFITLLTTFFQNMYLHKMIRQYFNRIREYRKDKKSVEAQMEQYKSEVSKSLTELYPDYEKEIFKSINPNDAEHLSALMVKYPELKFNGVLETYTNKISEFIKSIHGYDREINETIRRIEDIETSGWMLGSVDRPVFIAKLISDSE